MELQNKCCAIILAGGNSSRMGQHKALLRFNDGFYFYEKISLQFLKLGCKKVIISINSNAFKAVKKQKIKIKNIIFVENKYPEKGKLYSLQLALKEVDKGFGAFVHNVDNPFVELADLELLAAGIFDADYCVPQYKGRGGHPILLSAKAVKMGRDFNPDLDLRTFMHSLKRKNCPTDNENIRVNINTQADYLRYFPQS